MDKSKDVLNVFTDGSYRKKYNYCGYGVYFPNNEINSYGHEFTIQPLTNQRAELYAIFSALKRIKKYLETHQEITKINIYSDSQYSINCLTKWYIIWNKNDWKNSKGEDVLNQILIKSNLAIIQTIKKSGKRIFFHHVNSHTNNTDELSVNNDIVDKLANKIFFEKYQKTKTKKESKKTF